MKKEIKQSFMKIGLPVLLAGCLFIGLAIASTQFADEIKMEHKDAFDKHKKGIVMFTHKKHVEEHKLACGECHHDKDGKPLANLKIGDDVQPCLACHEKGQADKKALRGMAKDAKKKEEVKYFYGAIHENCKGCHEKYNVKKAGNKRKGPAPVSCNDCHPKNK